MSFEISNKWAQWQGRVFARADWLTARYTPRDIPIPLLTIVREQAVKHMVFRPLPIDGGISHDGEGFTIYVNANEADAARFHASVFDESDGGASLPPKVRFTIAHEIVHTFFYNLETRYTRVAGRHRKELASLERTCNQGAARLLVPERFLRHFLSDETRVSASELARLAHRFGVSAECLVYRLQKSAAWGETRRAAIYASDRHGDLCVSAVAMDGAMRSLFPALGYGVPLGAIGVYSNLIAFGGAQRHISVDVASKLVGSRSVQGCTIDCHPVATFPKDYLVTIRRDGQPRPVLENRGERKKLACAPAEPISLTSL